MFSKAESPQWFSVGAKPGQFCVNLGEGMSRWSNGRYKVSSIFHFISLKYM